MGKETQPSREADHGDRLRPGRPADIVDDDQGERGGLKRTSIVGHLP